MVLARSGLLAEDCLQNHFELEKAEGFTICTSAVEWKSFYQVGWAAEKEHFSFPFQTSLVCVPVIADTLSFNLFHKLVFCQSVVLHLDAC